MERIRLLWATFAISLVVSACSNSAEPPAQSGAAVGTGGAGANLKENDEFVHDLAVKNTDARD